jgi:hypothetical protein
MTLDNILLGNPMTKQDVADAMLLAPSGNPATGSVIQQLEAVHVLSNFPSCLKDATGQFADVFRRIGQYNRMSMYSTPSPQGIVWYDSNVSRWRITQNVGETSSGWLGPDGLYIYGLLGVYQPVGSGTAVTLVADDADWIGPTTLTADERNAVADALLNRSSAIDGKTPKETMQIIAALLAGIITDAGTGTETFLGLDGSTTRVVVTVDSAGNRSAVAYP